MEEKERLLAEFGGFLHFLSEIADMDWNQPLGPGKWSIQECISHILFWDRYFLEGAIEPITYGTPLTVKHVDFDIYNDKAAGYARSRTKEEIFAETKQCRERILECIASHKDNMFAKEYIDGDGKPFAVRNYLKDFIWHDNHHKEQIRSLLSGRSEQTR